MMEDDISKAISHGTPKGYRQHRQRGVAVCEECEAALPISHGTPKGYRQHKQRGIDVCDECRAAHRVHMDRYRAKHPEARINNRGRARERGLALELLKDRHPDEFQAILADLRSTPEVEGPAEKPNLLG